MSASAPKTYSSLRSDLRHQESRTEIALAELSSLTNSAPSQQDVQIEDTLLDLFARRRETIDAMSRVLDSDPSGGGARVHQVARAREILVEHEKEFRRMKSATQQARDREALTLSMKRPRSTQPASDTEMLITERDRIDHSHSIADSVLETAYATRSEFGRQRQTLTRLNQRLLQSASASMVVVQTLIIGQLPGINTIIGKINTRKKRDSVIIAALISMCIFGLIMFR